MVGNNVTVVLSEEEALVLFEWLGAINETEAAVADPAQRRVLWDLEAKLESLLPMVFDSHYAERVAAAKKAVSSGQ
ncbi:hypothetical protein GCM10009587_32440 [Microbacterium maritypicum]|nr:hypothetical protein D514_0107350 [Microbacterium sp. UCD-TDU]